MKILKRFVLLKSIFLKFTLAFIAVGLIPLLIFSYVSLNRFSNNIEKFTLNNFVQMVMYTGKNLEKVIADYNNISKLMYSYNSGDYGDLASILKIEDNPERRESLAVTKKNRMMDDFTKSVLYTDQHIQNIIFIDSNAKRVYTNTKETKLFDSGYDFTKAPQYGDILENKKQLTVLPTHVEEYYVRSNRQVVTFARNYLDTSTVPIEKVLGTILIDVDTNVFEGILSRLSLGERGEIYIVDDEGYCIYSNNPSSVTKSLDWYKEKRVELETEKDSGYTNSGDYYLIFQKIEGSHWQVVCKVFKDDVLKKVEDIRDFVIFIVFVCITALILVAIAFSKGFSLPVKRIIRQMKKVESGNLNVSVEVRAKDEVGQLAQGFNNMISELKGHIDKAYVAQIKQKDAELTALKTQIRPHFLYNTLEVIRMSAVENEDNKVADMIHSLSAQLKYVIGYNNDTVTLRQEIEMIQHYFKLIHVRYDGRIEFEMHIPEKLMQLQILKLSLQPIVENAVEHGIKPKDGKGRVLITAEVHEGNLEISIFDDGIGMSSEALNQVEQLLTGERMGRQTREGWKNVGIKNVHDRLRMNYGEKYGIDIKSHENIGTVVKVMMPVLEGAGVHGD